jgi:hypothetical protein
MSKHTPGPWTLTNYCGIAGVEGPPMGHDGEFLNKEDARLIAAAPDLLAVCLRAKQSLRDGTANVGHGPGEVLPSFVDDLNKAIAKATGENT